MSRHVDRGLIMSHRVVDVDVMKSSSLCSITMLSHLVLLALLHSAWHISLSHLRYFMNLHVNEYTV